MAGERDLRGRSEDAHPVVRPGSRLVRSGCGWEGRLGQVELPGDRLELVRAQRLRIPYDGKRIAGERAVGEDIDDVVRQHDAA